MGSQNKGVWAPILDSEERAMGKPVTVEHAKSIDGFLWSVLERAADEQWIRVSIQASASDWMVPAELRDEVRIGQRLGDTLWVSATKRAIKALAEDPGVVVISQ